MFYQCGSNQCGSNQCVSVPPNTIVWTPVSITAIELQQLAYYKLKYELACRSESIDENQKPIYIIWMNTLQGLLTIVSNNAATLTLSLHRCHVFLLSFSGGNLHPHFCHHFQRPIPSDTAYIPWHALHHHGYSFHHCLHPYAVSTIVNDTHSKWCLLY